MKNFELPEAPASLSGPVKAWAEPVVIPTYHPQAPDTNPMFLEKRVYQGSSGRVYPLPCIDRISTEAVEHSWMAVHIENEFLRLMMLPEIGGRIHVGLDKTNGYDFFYRQNVIKPALVGLAGPWISGGVEFNWPQHHRPSTFMPVDFEIEQHPDGARTIWCSDHDPMNRMKGMHGVCLHPGKSYIELKVRLYNRTPFVQTFLWWANVGVRVHELYQSFFPPDVQYVADHARRAMSRFPQCTESYYGVNYGQRARTGIPVEEAPPRFVPPGHYPPNDLSWYANIPVPTSYMAMDSKEDFHGGYDHRSRAGLVLIADHHIAPGKKQWTWGNHDFGYAWDRNLSDDGGPYMELMAGVFTDNQPDFSFLTPGETKAFSQFWYPIHEIGPAQKANKDAAISLARVGARVRLGVCVTQSLPAARVRLEAHGTNIAEWVRDLSPERPFVEDVPVGEDVNHADIVAAVTAPDGRELLRYSPLAFVQHQIPAAAVEPMSPEETPSTDELYLTGLHLEQYRHATRRAETYWQEALRRDPGDARCNNALGRWHLRRGEFREAEQCLRNAIQRLTLHNANPYDGEPYYNLGVTLRYLGQDQEAYNAFYKATWNQPWRSAASFALAEIDVKSGNWAAAFEHLETCVKTNSDHLNARSLMVITLRRLGRPIDGQRVLTETCAIDPMDLWARHLAHNALTDDNHMMLDLAFDYARCGLYEDAISVLTHADERAADGALPTVRYALAYFYDLSGHHAAAEAARSDAMRTTSDYCFPARLEELIVLESAIAANPSDARAAYYLGDLLYDRRRYEEAIGLWERSAQLDPSFSTVWRNLGIAYFNVQASREKARAAFDKAIHANPRDARVLYERDQLWKRTGEAPENRIREFENFSPLVPLRDDLSVELATLHNQTGQHEKAKALLESRRFQPWEGGEGLVLAQHVRAHLALGRNALRRGNADAARRCFEAALSCPVNLGEARHILANPSDIFYWLGVASDVAGDCQAAQQWWQRASIHKGDFQEMSVKSFSEMTYYNALALKRLGKTTEADTLLNELLHHAERLASQNVTIDYFATSLPAMLLFEDDLQKRNTSTATFLMAQAKFGLGEIAEARELLLQVLVLDQNHAMAVDLLPEVDALLAASGNEVIYTHRK
jgi:tetratricopeptide (TPR) repeat protein